MKAFVIFASFLAVQAYETQVIKRQVVSDEQLPLAELYRQPHYSLSIRNAFTTSTGAPLNLDCTTRYSLEMEEQALTTALRVNERINEAPNFCSNNKDHVIESASSAMSVTGNTGSFIIGFLMYPQNNATTLQTTYDCGSDVMNYVLPHSNWPNPILPILPGCPGINFSGSSFERIEEDWACGVN